MLSAVSIILIISIIIISIFIILPSKSIPSPPKPPIPPVPPVKNDELSIEYLTQEFSPYKYQDITDELTPWFNLNLQNLNKGDIAVFFTDYMIFNNTQLQYMNNALDKGAIIILGFDRWQLCGMPYSCDRPNICPNCNVQDRPKNVGCGCALPQVGGCGSIKNILDNLKYCNRKRNENNLLVIDQATDDDRFSDNIWGHAHRKMISFYRKNDVSTIFKGSWNIFYFNPGGAVKESGLSISGKTTSNFIQYQIQQDIDTLYPFYYFNQSSVDKKIIDVLQNIKNVNGYPKLPIIVDILWSGTDPTSVDKYNNKVKISGKDKDVKIWQGISPPPKNPQIQFNSNIQTIAEPNGPTDWSKTWNSIENQLNTYTIGDKSLDFATGNMWSGTVLQKFFDNSIKNKSSYIKISMYMEPLTIHPPCTNVMTQGGWGYGSSSCSGYDKEAWWTHGIGIYPDSIIKYLNQTNGTLQIIDGHLGMDTGSDWNPWLPTKLNELPEDIKKHIFIKFFNYAPTTDKRCWNCTGDDCTQTKGCARNHEKYYLSDSDLLLSSGHPMLGYYLDKDGINDDILFENAYSLVDYYNNRYENMWNYQAMTMTPGLARGQKVFTGSAQSWKNLSTDDNQPNLLCSKKGKNLNNICN